MTKKHQYLLLPLSCLVLAISACGGGGSSSSSADIPVTNAPDTDGVGSGGETPAENGTNTEAPITTPPGTGSAGTPPENPIGSIDTPDPDNTTTENNEIPGLAIRGNSCPRVQMPTAAIHSFLQPVSAKFRHYLAHWLLSMKSLKIMALIFQMIARLWPQNSHLAASRIFISKLPTHRWITVTGEFTSPASGAYYALIVRNLMCYWSMGI